MITQTPMQQLAQCRPKLADHVVKQSQVIRGEPWMLLQNSISGEHIRINASASAWLDVLDGSASVAEILRSTNADDATAQAFFACLNTLIQGDMLVLDDADEHLRLYRLYKTHIAAQTQRKRNPLMIRFPLVNPDSWLGSTRAGWSLLFNKLFVVLAICCVSLALAVAFVSTDELRQSWRILASTPAHWWWYGLLYPCLKLLHELAHAICIKRWGGSVHEAGITLLVLMPIPYVDASDSWLFENRSNRLITAAAGIIAEIIAVALALLVWSVIEPGLLRDIAFAVVVLGTLSTVFFNANPLLRFDGYFILQDAIDIPNLGARANAYYRYLVRRYVFGVLCAVTPCTAAGERRWLLGFGAAAFLYRVVITITIALFLAKQYFFIGVALAALALYQLIAKPAIVAANYLRHSTEISQTRSLVVAKCASLVVMLVATIAFVPLPSSTRAEGVVWVPNQAQVFAAETGTLQVQHIKPGQRVRAGDMLFTLTSPKLAAEYAAVNGEHQSVMVEYQAAIASSIEQAQQLAIDLKSLDAQLAVLRQRQAALKIRASQSGVLAMSGANQIVGSFVKQGDLLAFLVDDSGLVVRAVIDQNDMGKVNQGVTQSTVRLSDNFAKPLQSQIIQQVPAGNHQLPSPSLAYNGRSGIAVASTEGEQLRTMERVFHLELALPSESRVVGIGGRAYVNLKHQPESLGQRWWRSARQVLLKQLTV